MTDPRTPPSATERGYTLVELLVALTLASILTAMGLTIVSTFFDAEKVVNTSYGNLNQLLPVGTSFQQYIRSAVSPAPTPTTLANPGTPGQPVPPFGIYGSTAVGALKTVKTLTTSSLTFFTNIDNELAEVVAAYSGTSGTFTVTINSATRTCPTSDTSTSKCKFTPAKAKSAFTVDDVTNGTPSRPIFTYYLSGTTTPAPVSDFKNCTKTTGGCDADNIQSVGFNLVVNEDPGIGHSADQETVTYEVSSSSQAFNPAVG